jgi:thiamine-monophosphate kinase
MREFALLDHVFAHNASLPASVVIPPGDDMGAIAVGRNTVLVTVDQLADGVHVDLAGDSLAHVGRKAITRNLSDVAAMAAKPIGAVAAACLPRDFGEARANELFDAMRTTAAAYDCPLIGGDVAMWDHPMILTVTIFAESWPGIAPVLRSGAKVGDAVCVTGELGGSLAGHHLTFEPRLAAAKRLAESGATSMIDLSDGMGRDLGHICRASGVSAEVWTDALPIRATVTDQPRWRHALGDGEDYELCFTMPSDTVPSAVEGVPVTQVGRIIPRTDAAILIRLPEGSLQRLDSLGWEHHA